MDVDSVRKIDKQIETVQTDMASTEAPEQVESPHYQGFLKDNEWASDDDNPLSIAAEGIAIRYAKKHAGNIDDEKMYKHIHDQVRKDFPEKFETKRPATKVASAKKRSTTNHKKQGMSINDVADSDVRRVIENLLILYCK